MKPKKLKRDFNLAAKIFLVLMLIKLVTEIYSLWLNYRLISAFGESANSSTILPLIILNVILFVLIVFILRRSTSSLVILMILLFVKTMLLSQSNSTISSSYLAGQAFANVIGFFAPFAIALCFKKNGISGWDAFFASDEWIEEHYTSNEAPESKPNDFLYYMINKPSQVTVPDMLESTNEEPANEDPIHAVKTETKDIERDDSVQEIESRPFVEECHQQVKRIDKGKELAKLFELYKAGAITEEEFKYLKESINNNKNEE